MPNLNKALNDGATDGKYRKVRPNTKIAKGMGEELVAANRRGLHPYWNYDFIDQEAPAMVNPVSLKKTSAARSPMNVADVSNNQMLGTN